MQKDRQKQKHKVGAKIIELTRIRHLHLTLRYVDAKIYTLKISFCVCLFVCSELFLYTFYNNNLSYLKSSLFIFFTIA